MQRSSRKNADLFGKGSIASPRPSLAVPSDQIHILPTAFPRPSAMNVSPRFLLPALILALSAGCYQVPVTGRRAMNLVDDKEVTKMSIAMFDDMKKRYRPSRDPARIEQLK